MNVPVKPLVITDFSDFSHQHWRIINDGVMGGLSEGQFQINANGHALFLGSVSLENNGGFTMVKNHKRLNLTGFSDVSLRVRGDGKRYKFRFQTGKNSEQIHKWSYQHPFTAPKGRWDDIVLPLNGFVPVYRGRKMTDVPSLDPSAIYNYAFLISDKQKGEFRLEIESIMALP